MSGKPNPTVNNLRALFEQNRDSTSPPSRGRSPSGSETLTGDNPRPIAKVRTSFVAVERIGPMGPLNGGKKPSDNAEQDLGGDGGDEPKVVASPPPPQTSNANGNGVKTEAKLDKKEGDEKAAEGQNTADLSISDSSEAPSSNATHTVVDTPDPASQDESDSTQTSKPNVEESKLEASKPDNEPQGLGVVLKGAPFENEAAESINAAERQESAPPEITSSPPKPNGAVDQGPSGSPPKPATAAKQVSKPKPTLGSSRPSASSSKKLAAKAPNAGTTAPNEISTGSPKTPSSPNVAGRHTSSKTASPRNPGPPRAPTFTNKEPRKEPIPRISRPSIGTKVVEASGTKPEKSASAANGNAAKKPGLISPITKPQPKSPIRSVRLPAAATATTASSAAKAGEAPPSRSPSRSSVSNNTRKPAVLGRDRAAPSSNARKLTARTSLPAGSNETQKAKSRVSTASAKAPEGSFLARMMRPTQSSASKTHEKVEHAITKPHPTKTKRKSGGSEEDAKGPSVEEHPPALQEDESVMERDSVPPDDVNGTEAASTDATTIH